MPTITQSPPPLAFHNDLIYYEITTDKITNGVASEDNLSCYVEVFFKYKNGDDQLLTKLTVPYTSAGVAAVSLQGLAPLYPQPPSSDSLTNGTVEEVTNHAGILWIKYADQYGFPAVPETTSSGQSMRVCYGQSRFGFGFGATPSSYLLHSYYSDTNESFTRVVRKDQPEYVYIYAGADLTISPVVTFYYTDGTTGNALFPPTHSIGSDRVHAIPVSLDDLNISPDTSKDLAFYRLDLNGLPDGVNKTIFYQLDDHCSDYDYYLMYDNGVGGCEVLRCSGKKDFAVAGNKTTFQRTRWAGNTYQQGTVGIGSAEAQEQITISTGYYSAEMCKHLQQLVVAHAWHIDRTRNQCYAIIIDETEIQTYSEDDDLHSIQITFRYAWSRASLSNFQPSIIAGL